MSVRDNEVYWDSLARVAYNTIDKHADSLGAVLLERLNVISIIEGTIERKITSDTYTSRKRVRKRKRVSAPER